MTLQSVLGCKVCSALEKQSVLRSKVFFDAKCASANKRAGWKFLCRLNKRAGLIRAGRVAFFV